MLFANASKTIKNGFLTLQPENYLQYTKEGTRRGMDEHLKLYNIFVYGTNIYALICLCTYFIKIPELILHLKL